MSWQRCLRLETRPAFGTDASTLAQSLAVLLFSTGSLGTAAGAAFVGDLKPGNCVQLYRRSPIALHRALRQAAWRGTATSPCVQAVEEVVGDYSFHDFRTTSSVLRQALRLQDKAFQRWEGGDREGATRLYRQAVEILRGPPLSTESAFCHYYLAELATEAGELTQAEVYASTALATLDREAHPYLAALLEESRAFSLWYQGRLEEATNGFAHALAGWRRAGYLEGQAAGWNNLAAVFEELGLLQRAESCYIEALSCLRNDTAPEVRGRLFLNYALLAHRLGRDDRSLRFLGLARAFRGLLGEEYLLTHFEITGGAFPENEKSRPSSPESRIRYRLILAERALGEGRRPEAERLLREAEGIAERDELRFFLRPITLLLGKVLEASGRPEEALTRYDEMLRSRLAATPFLTSAFPFEKAYVDLLAGKLRVMTALGQVEEARRELARWHLLRRRALRPVLRRLAHRWPLAREASATVFAVASDSPGIDPRLPPLQEDFRTPKGMAEILLWPDGVRDVLAWIREGARRRFLRLTLSPETADSIIRRQQSWTDEPITFPPPSGVETALERLAHQLLPPLLKEIRSDRVVLTPHGWLEQVPFEILPLPGGGFFGLRYATSYAPAAAGLPTGPPATSGVPLALLSAELAGRSGYSAEKQFLRRTPEVQVYTDLPLSAVPRDVPWIYIGTHLRPDPRLWFLSHLGIGPQSESLVHLLQPPWQTRLMILAGCHGVQAGWESTPFWLGLSELVLASGVEGFVANRWALAERSVPIFLDTLAGALAGTPTDLALREARRKFVRIETRRSGKPPHPFFWGGVIFVGPPDHRLAPPLYREKRTRGLDWLPPALLLLGSLGHLGYLHRRYRNCR